jgi:hypothetical protein
MEGGREGIGYSACSRYQVPPVPGRILGETT